MNEQAAERLRAAVAAELPAAVELRRRIHRDPHLSGDEGPTRDLVLDQLPRGDGVVKVAETGAIVRIGGEAPAVAIRAELDALEVAERTGVPWQSATPGFMHGCGHDVHLAALVAVARAVDRVGGPLPLLAVLQPREESAPSGARDILASGALGPDTCRAVLAAHVQPSLPNGVVACVPGVVNASSDEFAVEVSGRGGHAAYPHTGSDPLVVVANIVTALQSVRHRTVDPTATAVLTVTRMAGGTTTNVVPDHAGLAGTVRTTTARDRELMLDRLAAVSSGIATAFGCGAEVSVVRGEPPLANDERLARATAAGLARLGVPVDGEFRSAGADDFSYYTEVLPSLMMFVGVGDGSGRLHSATFLPSDQAVADVARAMLTGYLAAARG
ncbi:M20 family metallopeptidase [Streptomyces sp. B6B3]|uniref:M20 metallopeptidase family protein n=1 Tax=Streptomyces sp. B6B3 TaxID=3153570 RepID=UPI00325EE9A0